MSLETKQASAVVGGWGVDKLGTFDWGGGKLSESEREEDKL